MPFSYRSTNNTGYTHFQGALVVGTQLESGIELNPTSSAATPTILPAGDESAKNIMIAGKGAGGVQIGAASTTPFTLIQRHLLQFTVPALSSAGVAGASVDSTVTFAGASTSDVYIVQQRAPYNSTVTVGVDVKARSTAADELTLTFFNHGASSISGSTMSAILLRFAF